MLEVGESQASSGWQKTKLCYLMVAKAKKITVQLDIHDSFWFININKRVLLSFRALDLKLLDCLTRGRSFAMETEYKHVNCSFYCYRVKALSIGSVSRDAQRSWWVLYQILSQSNKCIDHFYNRLKSGNLWPESKSSLSHATWGQNTVNNHVIVPFIHTHFPSLVSNN